MTSPVCVRAAVSCRCGFWALAACVWCSDYSSHSLTHSFAGSSRDLATMAPPHGIAKMLALAAGATGLLLLQLAPSVSASSKKHHVHHHEGHADHGLVLEETFSNGFNLDLWKHEITAGGLRGGNWEFQFFSNSEFCCLYHSCSPSCRARRSSAVPSLTTSGHRSLWLHHRPKQLVRERRRSAHHPHSFFRYLWRQGSERQCLNYSGAVGSVACFAVHVQPELWVCSCKQLFGWLDPPPCPVRPGSNG
jgi:hypothetical protein